MRMCWCGNTEFLPFNAQYGKCVACGTLVSQDSLTDEELVVDDDETDFYGKQYWLGHQADDLGFPDIYARARNDLTERNLHWLRTLLKYCPPPACTLELGCGHGSFVGLMAQAGYAASGIEMSAWVVEFGKNTFNVPIGLGPIEGQPIAEGSLDAIVSFDVLEHLPDPSGTMERCLRLLKPDGILLIQTPQFREEMSFGQLVGEGSPFLVMLQPGEHLYLFTENSATRLFAQLGASHMKFEPAIFSKYDMFFAVSRTEMKSLSQEQSEVALAATPGGRIAQALLDLGERELALSEALRIADADRTQRGEQVVELKALFEQAEADRNARGEQIEVLKNLLEESERDRGARGEQVVELKSLFEQAEADRNARGEQISVLEKQLQESDRDRAARGEQVVDLTNLLAVAEADRLARGQQIESLAALLKESEADRAARDEGLKALTHALQESERDRELRGADIATLTRFAETADADRVARGEQVETLTALLKEAEADRAARGDLIATLTTMLAAVEHDRAERGTQIETLAAMLRQAEADRAAREQSLAAWRQRVETALQRRSLNPRARWSEIRNLLEEIGHDV